MICLPLLAEIASQRNDDSRRRLHLDPRRGFRSTKRSTTASTKKGPLVRKPRGLGYHLHEKPGELRVTVVKLSSLLATASRHDDADQTHASHHNGGGLGNAVQRRKGLADAG